MKKSLNTFWSKVQAMRVFTILLLMLYGGYFLYLFLSAKILLLVHKDFAFLSLVCGLVFLLLAVLEMVVIFSSKSGVHQHDDYFSKHTFGTVLLFVPIVLAFLSPPRPLSSATATVRQAPGNVNLGASLGETKAAGFLINTESRTFIDWLRLFAQEPDPIRYENVKAKISGFVHMPDDTEAGMFYLSRFVLSCCAADARPVSIPIVFDAQKFSFKENEWIEVQGVFVIKEMNGEKVPVLQLNKFTPIPVPENPYVS